MSDFGPCYTSPAYWSFAPKAPCLPLCALFLLLFIFIYITVTIYMALIFYMAITFYVTILLYMAVVVPSLSWWPALVPCFSLLVVACCTSRATPFGVPWRCPLSVLLRLLGMVFCHCYLSAPTLHCELDPPSFDVWGW